MLKFNELELCYLRRVLSLRLASLERQILKNRRYYRDTDDDVLWQSKVGNLEAEFDCLTNIKSVLNQELALFSFLSDKFTSD